MVKRILTFLVLWSILRFVLLFRAWAPRVSPEEALRVLYVLDQVVKVLQAQEGQRAENLYKLN
jgi:hypothetical protein